MTSFIKTVACAAGLWAGLLGTSVQANSVNWGAEGGPTEFVSAAIGFTGFEADTLVSVTSQGTYFTNNGSLNPVTFNLDILLDGSWTNIFTDVTTGTSFVNAIPTQTFAFGTVTGIRATGQGQVQGDPTMRNWALGQGFTPTVFNFDAVSPPAVPLPASVVLLLVGLAGLGLFGRRAA